MKTSKAIFLSVYVCWFLGCSLEQREEFFETTVFEYRLSDSHSLRIVHDANWEVSIPIRFRGYVDGSSIFKSAVFGGFDPEEVDDFEHIFSLIPVNGMDGVFVLFRKGKPNEIVGYVDFQNRKHFPMSKVTESEYLEAEEFFSKINESLGFGYTLKK